jgi:hypothetical protein
LVFTSTKNKTAEDFYVSTEYEQLAYWFIVATDVGGGFNWFTDLDFTMGFVHGCYSRATGAWLSAVPYSKG